MKGLFKISLPTKATIFGASILVVLIAGIGSFLISQNQINNQKTQIALLQKTIQKNNDQINTLVKNNASQSAKITALMSQPTPTPIVEYRTNTVTKTQYVDVPGQSDYYSAPPKPVTYIQAGSELMGSNGSTCIMAGSELNCTGGR